MQRITLRAILRAVFGAEGARLHALEELIPRWTALGARVSLAPELRLNLGRFVAVGALPARCARRSTRSSTS